METVEIVVNSLVEALRDRATEGFNKSQAACPVVTGELKKSGSIKDIENGSEINYSAPYASIVERGQDAGMVYVQGHVRTTKRPAALTKNNKVTTGNSHYVKSYRRLAKAIEGKHFIENSLKEAFNTLNNAIDTSLRVKFARVIRE